MSDNVGYWFSLDNMVIARPRARDTDTDVVSLTSSRGDQIFANATKDLGKVRNGEHAIGLRVPVLFSDPATEVRFGYQIMNSGFDRSDASRVKGVMDQLSDGAAKLVTGLFGFKVVWDKLNDLTHWINDLLFANCDGLVAGDAIAVSGHDLQGWTAQSGRYQETRQYPGKNSPPLCGETSLYSVTWSVTRITSLEEIQRISMQGGTSM
jgi:hypothetical protein